MPATSTHPSIAYAAPYDTAETLFGKEMSAQELIDRVRSFSWAGSFLQLACLAAVVANEPGGSLSERVRRLTVDPISRLTGNATCAGLLARGQAAVQSRRDQIILAHEEVISFLQHLVILEGAESGDAPGAPEVALWLAGANGQLARWSVEERESLSDDEALAAELVRISRFNNRPDPLRALVRTHCIFGRKPSTGTLNDAERWRAVVVAAYPSGFDESFETGLGLVAMQAQRWGTQDDPSTYPVMNLDRFLAQSRITREAFVNALHGYIAKREELRTVIRKRTRQDGLPHSPSALFHTPLVELEPGVLVAASPWAVTGLLRTGVWARFLRAAKSLDSRRGGDEWLRSFGYMFEDWCRYVATEAESSLLRRATILLPSSPGAVDEVEDVVVVDDGVAVFCSAKSRLVEAKVAREAVSATSIVDWFEKFFFETKGDDYRGGVVRQLSARIDKLRSGEFESSGLSRDTRVIPVVVTYDSLGESDILYRRVEEGCVRHGLLQQAGVGPLALARVEEFEQLLSRVARGKPVSELLLAREGIHRHRRLDQILYEAEAPAPPRLPFFEREWKLLTQRMVSRVTGKQA
jgi:hypothetical protein